MPMPQNTPRSLESSGLHSTNLDVLRSFAVLLVFVFHLLNMLHLGGEAYKGAAAHFGVVLFFVHTSCVLMGSLQTLGPSSPKWAIRFYIRRAFRIYPLAIIVVLLALITHCPAAAWMGSQSTPFSGRMLASNLLLIQNIMRQPFISGPVWSLPLEVDMYLVLPAVFLLIRTKHWAAIMAGFWITAIGLVAALHGGFDRKLALLLYIPCFISGALAYRLRESRLRFSSNMWIPSLVLLIVVNSLVGMNVYVIWAACFALAFLYAHTDNMSVSWFSRTCAVVSKYSYGIYLFHAFALWVAFDVAGSLLVIPASKVLVTILLTAAASWAVFHWVENPMIQLGRRLADRMEYRAALTRSLASPSLKGPPVADSCATGHTEIEYVEIP
jgi:peptidoglycan/LPS O-acetylase OafA/YrhL